jgi:DNA-binding transcriptional LysR family regulator
VVCPRFSWLRSARRLLARAGAGLVQTYRFIVEQDPERGDLVELLPRFGGASHPFILPYPQARHMSARVRTFVDFLLGQLARPRA